MSRASTRPTPFTPRGPPACPQREQRSQARQAEDAQRGDARLRERGIETSGAVWLDMGPEIPVEGVYANFFPDPDGSCLELIGLPVVDSTS